MGAPGSLFQCATNAQSLKEKGQKGKARRETRSNGSKRNEQNRRKKKRKIDTPQTMIKIMKRFTKKKMMNITNRTKTKH